MTKKPKKNEPKPREFAAKPFSNLKGLKVQEAAPPGKAPEKPVPPVREQTASDRDLFLREMAGVRPMATVREEKKVPPKQEVTAAMARLDEAEQRDFLAALERLQLDVRFEDQVPDEDNPLKPLSTSRMRQLKRGEVRIDLELDLHGLTREEALQNLTQFLAGAYNRGQKAVLVITGKGNRSADEPVLLGAVAGWLRDKGREFVAEYSPAPREMGGGGAFVVFLRDKGKPTSQKPQK